MDTDVILFTVADAVSPTRVHVGQTRELEPAIGSCAAARAEYCVAVMQVSVRGAAGAVHTPLTQVLGGAQVAVEQAAGAAAAEVQAVLEVLPVEEVVCPEGHCVQDVAELAAAV